MNNKNNLNRAKKWMTLDLDYDGFWIDSKYKLQEWKHFKCKHKTALSCIYSQDILRNFSPFSLDQTKAKVKVKAKAKVNVKVRVKLK